MHAGNPANYDPLFALLLLGYFLLIDAWERRRHPVWLAAAGLCLSLLELTRPFMIFLLPLFLLVEVASHPPQRAPARACAGGLPAAGGGAVRRLASASLPCA